VVPTHDDVAKWMDEYVARHGELPQDEAAEEIEARFGAGFVYENENGNLAISKDVLKKFRERTENTVVWEPGYREWRKRERGDPPGRSTRET
jgi:hypothetical protein